VRTTPSLGKREKRGVSFVQQTPRYLPTKIEEKKKREDCLKKKSRCVCHRVNKRYTWPWPVEAQKLKKKGICQKNEKVIQWWGRRCSSTKERGSHKRSVQVAGKCDGKGEHVERGREKGMS